MSDLSPLDATPTTPPTSAPPPRKRWARGLGWGAVVLCGLLGYFLLVVYFGWRSGEQLLVERRQEQLQSQLTRQLTLAQTDMDEGRYALAQRRLTWVLGISPNDPTAQSLLDQTEVVLSNYLTPQASFVTPTPMPTAVPSPTAEPIDDPGEALTEMNALAKDEEWEALITAVTGFQRQFPNYQRQETDTLLYNGYVNAGTALLGGEQVELGLFYLTQAEKLGSLSQDVLDQRIWAELYLQGISFYGTNWGASAYYFRDLCLAAPFYQTSCDRLYEVLVAYADQYAFAQDWCPAVDLYREAQEHKREAEVSTKLQTAQTGCLSATPTPLAPITNTLPITESLPQVTPSGEATAVP